MTHRVVLAFGTRPEAIKMAPVYSALAETPGLEPLILLTGQHREQLEQALELFDVPVARDLELMTRCQTLPDLAGRIVPAVAAALDELQADYVLVHGDTLTTFASAWAAFLTGRPVGHVEAGLRSGSLAEPFPEEGNRLLTDRLSDLLFAPTERAGANLRAEGFPDRSILVTGQTGVDAILMAARQGTWPRAVARDDRPLVTVTLHRRENWPVLEPLAQGLAQLADRFADHRFVVPLHLNPLVRERVAPPLERCSNVQLLDPLPYGEMARLMSASRLLLTDSGGLQEEGAALGVPVAIVRNVTERPEGLGGALELVGNDPATFEERVAKLLGDSTKLAAMAASPNPYGDGRASRRVADALVRRLEGER